MGESAMQHLGKNFASCAEMGKEDWTEPLGKRPNGFQLVKNIGFFPLLVLKLESISLLELFFSIFSRAIKQMEDGC